MGTNGKGLSIQYYAHVCCAISNKNLLSLGKKKKTRIKEPNFTIKGTRKRTDLAQCLQDGINNKD